MRYSVGFGLFIAVSKGILSTLQGKEWPDTLMDMALYLLVAMLIAVPLYYFKQERQRSGAVMDRIILLCIALVVAGGIVHDQITVRVSKEYYTIGHFPIPGIENVTLLALIWGFLGTWWFGSILGMCLAMVSCAGQRPHFPIQRILQISLIPMLVIESIAWLMAMIGYALTRQGIIGLEMRGMPHLFLRPITQHLWLIGGQMVQHTAY